MADLWREDLVPYRALLGELSFIMVSHAAYKAYDFDVLRTASQSSAVLEGLLRAKLGYPGVAIADLREPEPTQWSPGVGEAAVHSVNAGCDMLVAVPGEKSAGAILNSLEAGIEVARLSTQRLTEALGRIGRAQRQARPPQGRISQVAVGRLRRRFNSFSEGSHAAEEQDQEIA
jgi:beta-N-acetylhexosaminidase